MTGNPRYLVGQGTTPYPENGLPSRLTVVFLPKASWVQASEPDDPHVLVEMWQDGTSTGPTLTPKAMLDYRPYVPHKVGDKTTFEQDSPGWFERKCVEANCSWFVPLAKRMAAGEKVPIEEIQTAYKSHNDGQEMPCGALGKSFF